MLIKTEEAMRNEDTSVANLQILVASELITYFILNMESVAHQRKQNVFWSAKLLPNRDLIKSKEGDIYLKN